MVGAEANWRSTAELYGRRQRKTRRPLSATHHKYGSKTGAPSVGYSIDRYTRNLVMLLYINFTTKTRHIDGFIAFLMDLPAIEKLKDIVDNFIMRVAKNK